MTDNEIIGTLGKMYEARVGKTLETEGIRSFNVNGKGFVLIALVYDSGHCILVNPIDGATIKDFDLKKEIEEGGEE